MSDVLVGCVRVWVCRCYDWYDGPRKFDLFTLVPGVNVCHRWDCGWTALATGLDLETQSAVVEEFELSVRTVIDVLVSPPRWYCAFEEEPSPRWPWSFGDDSVQMICPVCMEFVPQVCAGFDLVGQRPDHPGTDDVAGHMLWECPELPSCDMVGVVDLKEVV